MKMSKIAIARITGQNGEEIKLSCDTETFAVTADNGDEITYGDTPKSAAEAFALVHAQWGVDPLDVWRLEWLAEYDADTNEITPCD
jgi:hypothetical protein